ncbi:MAG: M20/M25/M40 family metallo-hydrolase [Acidobacteria bacterium]|nr:M20/M25/M40 family metallo-hydrolase [Acidobacteriota bacterium]
MRKNLVTIFLFVVMLVPSAAFAQTVKVSSKERKMAETIKADQLSNWLHFIASDAMAGRDTPSQGLDVTAEFLKMKLSRWGFKPAGDDGTFFQKIALSMTSIDPKDNSLVLNGQKYDLVQDFFRISGDNVGEGSLVFGGNGWMVKAKNIDALKDVDVRGKIVVLYDGGFPNRNQLTRMPEGVTQADLTGTKGTDWADPLTYAAQKGAVGIIMVASDELQNSWAQIGRFLGRGGMTMDKLNPAPQGASLPVALVSTKIRDVIFAGESGNISSKTAFAINKTAKLETKARSERKWTQNVVALWEGSDPVLKNEMVAVGAHYDHVGVNENAPGEDKIWNGADDDGSGTIAVLAIAEALAKAKTRPKRSVLLVWHTAEEKGLLGANYFNKFPTVDIKNVVAQLNIDMIGRSRTPQNAIPCDQPRKRCNDELAGPNEVYVIGADMMSSTLGAITKGTNSAYLKMDYNFKYDDPKDPNRFFFRSDHFHYAQNGIPIAFWFTGVHEDYHQPEDHADKIDYAKYEKITRTIFMTMWKLSDLKERPKIDKQLPPELTGSR